MAILTSNMLAFAVTFITSGVLVSALQSRMNTSLNTTWEDYYSDEMEKLYFVSLLSVDTGAKCVDGSIAGFYFRESPVGSSTWLILLEGGGSCVTTEGCARRCPRGTRSVHCSSKEWPDSVPAHGMMNPRYLFGDANQVFVKYCTSDAYLGNTKLQGRYFRGARVIHGVFKKLVSKYGLGSGKYGKEKVVLSGQSAGARGAMAHLDYIPEVLGEEAAKNVELFGIFDSPLWTSLPPASGSNFIGFDAWCKDAYKAFNIRHLDSRCVADHPHGDAYKCILAEHRLPYVRTPYLIIASQFDLFQLNMNGINAELTSAQREYVTDLREHTTELMKSLRSKWPRHKMQNAVFSCACLDHPYTNDDRRFHGMTCGGITMENAVREFLEQRRSWLAMWLLSRPKLEWIDDCKGFDCGRGCVASGRDSSHWN
eukprot:TRINITY_DN75212_c0_g1_i1.p1 TRINITY_DN75212_c0_g1~~TRINITY_DN75212_c0_g1_i1.p1  ORF type:complete len:425 (+),score=83.05 TRINITY_DN75212_c0_g1_i1:38-1312(+)